MTHRELCKKAAAYMVSTGIKNLGGRCVRAAVELELPGESPDAIGWSGNSIQLIEVKVTRSDFLSDKKKKWRRNPEQGMGSYRSYMCPQGLIKPEELPSKWGLLYVDEAGRVTKIVDPEYFAERNGEGEVAALLSVMRRLEVGGRVYSFKKYKNDHQEQVQHR